MSTKLLIRILSSELPLDGFASDVALGLPCVDFALQKLRAGDAAIQALAAEDADLDFRHVQPARVLGRVVKAHATQQLVGRALAQHIVEALPEVNVQVVPAPGECGEPPRRSG